MTWSWSSDDNAGSTVDDSGEIGYTGSRDRLKNYEWTKKEESATDISIYNIL
jgi:hypothetical protein